MWMNFGIKDLIDVLLVAFFLYQTYKLMKNSGTLAIFSGVVSFIIVWILVSQVSVSSSPSGAWLATRVKLNPSLHLLTAYQPFTALTSKF